MEAVIARVTVIWRQLLPDWKSEMNELVHVFGVYVYMFIYVHERRGSGVGRRTLD